MKITLFKIRPGKFDISKIYQKKLFKLCSFGIFKTFTLEMSKSLLSLLFSRCLEKIRRISEEVYFLEMGTEIKSPYKKWVLQETWPFYCISLSPKPCSNNQVIFTWTLFQINVKVFPFQIKKILFFRKITRNKRPHLFLLFWHFSHQSTRETEYPVSKVRKESTALPKSKIPLLSIISATWTTLFLGKLFSFKVQAFALIGETFFKYLYSWFMWRNENPIVLSISNQMNRFFVEISML